MALAHIAFGGNQAGSRAAFRAAVEMLDADCGRVAARSSLWSSAAMGADAGDDFVNAAVSLRSTWSPAALLRELHRIEATLGRIRVLHWGPRVLDLDLVLYEHVVLETPEVTVPHPSMWYRAFVLQPLAEIAPDCIHPLTGLTVAELNERTASRPLKLLWQGRPGMSAQGVRHLTDVVRQRTGLSALEFVSAPDPARDAGCDGEGAVARLRPIARSRARRNAQPRHTDACEIELETSLVDHPWDDEAFVQQVCDVVAAIDGRLQVVTSPADW